MRRLIVDVPNHVALRLAAVRKQVSQSDYTNGSECSYGFHVFKPGVEQGDRCYCGRSEFASSPLQRGFIKLFTEPRSEPEQKRRDVLADGLLRKKFWGSKDRAKKRRVPHYESSGNSIKEYECVYSTE